MVYSQALKAPPTRTLPRNSKYATEERPRADHLKQIDYLGGDRWSHETGQDLTEGGGDARFDLQNEPRPSAVPRARTPVRSLGEFAMAEHIREILIQEQEHQIDLATALGEDPPDNSG